MRLPLLLAVAAISSAGAAVAQTPPESPPCASLVEDKERLACYDAAAKSPKKPESLGQLLSNTPPPAPVAPAPNTSGPPQSTIAAKSADTAATSSPAADAASEPATATTKDIVAPVSPSDYKVADPADLHIAPRKFRGKPIEIRHTHCYYADVGDYRCVAPGYSVVAIFTPTIGPAEEKSRLEEDCGAVKAMTTPKCERTLHLSFDTYDEDQVDAMTNRVVLKPDQVTLIPSSSGKKKR